MKIFEKDKYKKIKDKSNVKVKSKRIQLIKKNLYNIKIKIKEDNISEYAAEAAYFTILSSIPFLLFFISIMKFTNMEKISLYIILRNFFPYSIYEFLINILEEIYSKSFKVFSVSSIIIIWSAGKGFFSLSKGLKNIYKINIQNNFFLRILGSIYTLILIFLIIIILILTIVGRNIYFFIMKTFQVISKYIFIIYKLKDIFIILLLIFIFYILYKLISEKKSKEYFHIYGAIFAAVIWRISLYFLSIYINFQIGFSNMYGSLSSIIIIMMWIYMSMYIILLGAEINVLCKKRKIKKICKKS